jgi:hypothetical protein
MLLPLNGRLLNVFHFRACGIHSVQKVEGKSKEGSPDVTDRMMKSLPSD